MNNQLTFRETQGLAYFVLIWSLLMLAGAWAVDETKGWFNSWKPQLQTSFVCAPQIGNALIGGALPNPIAGLPFCKNSPPSNWRPGLGPPQSPSQPIVIRKVRLQGPKNCSGIPNRRRPRIFDDGGCFPLSPAGTPLRVGTTNQSGGIITPIIWNPQGSKSKNVGNNNSSGSITKNKRISNTNQKMLTLGIWRSPKETSGAP